MSNTNGILVDDCHRRTNNTVPAALAARSLGEEWFLPSIDELSLMFENRALLEAVSGFDSFSNYYWSSTELNRSHAWTQFFFNGNQTITPKFFRIRYTVRAVRAF
jgi:hypothetical protein